MEILYLYVADAYRRYGVGKALMKHIDAFARDQLLKAVDLRQLPPESELDEERNFFTKSRDMNWEDLQDNSFLIRIHITDSLKRIENRQIRKVVPPKNQRKKCHYCTSLRVMN